MQIKFSSVNVKDQDAALRFYTEMLGFHVVTDIAAGPYRWLTVASGEGVQGVELLLESIAFPPAAAFQQAKYDAGIPSTVFITRDIQAEYASLKAKGVIFRGEPQSAGPALAVLFEDGCGNLINLVQPPSR